MSQVIYLTEDIVPTSGESTKDNSLIKYMSESIMKADNLNKEPIHILVDTDGGNVKTALAIYDIIQAAHAPVYTYALSEVSSAGVLIFIAGKKRYSFKHSMFMMHPSSLSVSGNQMEFESSMDMVMGQTIKVEDIFKKQIKMSKRNYNKFHSLTHFIEAGEAKKLKIVTEIIEKIPEELLSAHSSGPSEGDIKNITNSVMEELLKHIEIKESQSD